MYYFFLNDTGVIFVLLEFGMMNLFTMKPEKMLQLRSLASPYGAATGRAEAGGERVQDLPELQAKFEASLGNWARSYLKRREGGLGYSLA